MQYVADPGRRAVTLWLYAVAVMILLMLTVGGLTRLTGSGLSMVDWKPIMGTLPPLSEEAWQEKLEAYRQFPEYQKVNKGMSLDEFKTIFYWEWGHRVLGRLIGLVFFVPFMVFWARGWLSPPMIRRCVLLFILGGLQGLIGWWMVTSGLVDVPHVSQYRLTVHLTMAIMTLTLCIWFALDLQPKASADERRLMRGVRGAARWILILVGVQIITGGFVAGLKAGKSFNTFPTMNGDWVPGSLMSISPWYRNFFDNPAMVQFIHRWLAVVVTVSILYFFFRHYRVLFKTKLRPLMMALPILLVIQVTLGIVTLLMGVPVIPASAHQVVAVLLWSSLLVIRHHSLYA